MAFALVHEMELQAHFAPVGLMFDQGTLSDWDKYQDQTIWDRIKETGKEIFYRVEYSKTVLSLPDKIKEDKAYVEGEGKNRLISTAIVNNEKIKEWIDKAKEELKIEENWYTNVEQWWQGDKKYEGSGWGHGARTELYNALGMDDDADNLIEAGMLSMLQRGKIKIKDKSRLAKKLTEDPALQIREKDIAKIIVNDPRYLKENFSIDYKTKEGIQFGGKRAEGAMWKQFVMPFSPKYKDTWKVAANELTWLVRTVFVVSTIKVKKDGGMTIYHSFEDKFDLRPSSHGERSIEYDVVSIVTGFLYHDAAGGNDLMKIEANWSNEYSRIEVVNKSGDEEAMKKLGNEMADELKDFFKSLPIFK